MKSLFYQLSCYSVLIPMFIGITLFRKLDRKSVVITCVCLLASIPQLIAIWLGRSSFRYVFYNFYTLCDVIFLLTFFYYALQTATSKKLFLFAIVGCGCTAIIFLTGFSIFTFHNYWVCINSFIYIILTLSVFAQRINVYQEKLLDFSVSETWYLFAFLLYNTSTFLVMLLRDSLGDENPLWNIHNIFNTLFYVLLAVGLYKNVRLRPNF